MIPVMQTTFGGKDDPFEVQGNCIAACLASIFEIALTDVPDIAADGNWYLNIQEWLAPRNLCLVPMNYEPGPLAWATWGFAMIGTKSPRINGGHLVVTKGFGVVHDPHPDAIEGYPGEPEEWWFLVCLDPSKQPVL